MPLLLPLLNGGCIRRSVEHARGSLIAYTSDAARLPIQPIQCFNRIATHRLGGVR